MKNFDLMKLLKSKDFYYWTAIAVLTVMLAFVFRDCACALAVVVPVTTGKIVSGAPLTTEITRGESEDLLLNEVDKRITRIRPMATPIDQLSRHAGARRSGSMVVDYYSVDVKPTKATLAEAYTEPGAGSATASAQKVQITTDNNDIFEPSETILVQGVKGYESDGKTPSKADLVLYISSKEESGELNVYAVNGKTIGNITGCVPSIEQGTPLIRMGRAATELDVQTAQFEALPVKDQNFCQIFKMQIEQSTFQKIANKEEVSFTGGIWWQAGKEYTFDPEKELTEEDLIDIMKESFTGNGGNKRKILIGGSDFIGRINKLDVNKVVSAEDDFVKWGIDFSEVRSKFGRLFVLYSEVFDECGMSDYGFIFDPEYLSKWSHVPFDRQVLDLKGAGVRNTDAVVLTEASCLTLRYPAAHMRIIPKKA